MSLPHLWRIGQVAILCSHPEMRQTHFTFYSQRLESLAEGLPVEAAGERVGRRQRREFFVPPPHFISGAVKFF